MFTLFRFGHVRKVTCLVSCPYVHFISVRSCPEGDLLGILSMCSLYFGSVKSGRWLAWCPVRMFTLFRFGHVRQKTGWGPYTRVCTSPSSLSTLRSSLVRTSLLVSPGIHFRLLPLPFAWYFLLKRPRHVRSRNVR